MKSGRLGSDSTGEVGHEERLSAYQAGRAISVSPSPNTARQPPQAASRGPSVRATRRTAAGSAHPRAAAATQRRPTMRRPSECRRDDRQRAIGGELLSSTSIAAMYRSRSSTPRQRGQFGSRGIGLARQMCGMRQLLHQAVAAEIAEPVVGSELPGDALSGPGRPGRHREVGTSPPYDTDRASAQRNPASPAADRRSQLGERRSCDARLSQSRRPTAPGARRQQGGETPKRFVAPDERP
jgi:hypothetical protein